MRIFRIVTCTLLMTAACATTSETSASQAADGTPPKTVPVESVLREADTEIRTLDVEVKNLHKEFGTALYAVNRMLFRNPQCVDTWFQHIAHIDENIATTKSNVDTLHKRLVVQHRLFTKAKADFHEVHQVRNQIQVERDRILDVKPRLAFLLAETMNRSPSCTTPKAVSVLVP